MVEYTNRLLCSTYVVVHIYPRVIHTLTDEMATCGKLVTCIPTPHDALLSKYQIVENFFVGYNIRSNQRRIIPG